MPKRPFMRLFTADWRDGTRALSFEERGFYLQIVTHLHDGDRVPADPKALAVFLQCDPRTTKRLTDDLVAKGKIYIIDGWIRNRRVDRDLGETSTEDHSEVAEKSARSRREVATKSPEKPTKSSVEKGHHNHIHIHIQEEDPHTPTGGRDSECLTAFQEWNDLALRCGLQQAARLSPGRKKLIGARIKAEGLDGWRKALALVEQSAFLRGMTGDRKWRATLDWTLKASNFDKLIEGTYGNGAHAEVKKSSLQILEELCSEQQSPC